jgi:hypothetical protein
MCGLPNLARAICAQLVQKPLTVAAVHFQVKTLPTALPAAADCTEHVPPNAFRKVVNEEGAEEFKYELAEKFENHGWIMALFPRSGKQGVRCCPAAVARQQHFPVLRASTGLLR